MQLLRFFLFACAIAAAVSVPVAPTDGEVPPGPVPPTPSGTCSFLMTSAACNANTCCNWCGITFNATIGWCMPLIPIGPVPSLQCTKSPANCKTVFTEADCYFQDECKWVPFGPPGTAAGMCVYDWDRCKTPPPADEAAVIAAIEEAKTKHTKQAAHARIATKTAKRQQALANAADDVVVPPGPSPKLTCNMTDSASCDHSLCCQWCQPPFSPTPLSGFCMPVSNIPIPALTCDKSVVGCEKILSQSSCTSSKLCTWMPIGPPGSGVGKCIFDWDKCMVADE